MNKFINLVTEYKLNVLLYDVIFYILLDDIWDYQINGHH